MMGIFSGAKIALVLVLLSVAGGGYLYVKNLQKDVDRLAKNNVLLETAVNSKDREINRLNEEIVEVREANNRVTEESRKLNNEVQRIKLLQDELFPNQSLEERQRNFSEYYLEYGSSFLKAMKGALISLQLEFTIIEL